MRQALAEVRFETTRLGTGPAAPLPGDRVRLEGT
jgi:hypothetical protein